MAMLRRTCHEGSPMQEMTQTTLAAEVLDDFKRLAESVGADLCILFGSRTAASTRAGADVDLALSFQKMPAPTAALRSSGASRQPQARLPWTSFSCNATQTPYSASRSSVLATSYMGGPRVVLWQRE